MYLKFFGLCLSNPNHVCGGFLICLEVFSLYEWRTCMVRYFPMHTEGIVSV
jgi:hypothetical protein